MAPEFSTDLVLRKEQSSRACAATDRPVATGGRPSSSRGADRFQDRSKPITATSLFRSLKQSGVGDVPLSDVSAKIRELLTEEKVNELMVSWLQSLRSESKVSVPGTGESPGEGVQIAVTEPAARPRRWWKYSSDCSWLHSLSLESLRPGTSPPIPSRAYVRSRLVKEVERITGGRAEIGSFHVVPFHLQVEVRNITVHGKEAANDVPLAHADSLLAQVKVISLLRPSSDLTRLCSTIQSSTS